MNGKKYPGLSFHLLLHRISDGDDHALILPWSEKKLEQMYPRTVKKRPTVYTAARIGAARANIRKYAWARWQANACLPASGKSLTMSGDVIKSSKRPAMAVGRNPYGKCRFITGSFQRTRTGVRVLPEIRGIEG